jgi:Flp pilus assembly protein TadD
MSRSGRWILGLILIGGCVGAALSWLVLSGTTQNRHENTALPDETNADPRRTFESSFENIRPEIEYVGDAACAECHQDIASAYRQHPMGRALAPIDPERDGVGLEFERNGYRYRIERREGRVFHMEERLSASGELLARLEREVKFALGSGTRGRAFFIENEGRIFTSPISWYRLTSSWDLAPEHPEHLHFSRPIVAGCLVCHANRVEIVEGTVNRYKPPVFRGFGIGCERCHGPGSLHVQRRESGERIRLPDFSIVNPARLPPDLAGAICQQCHLKGEERVLAEGRGPFDFRPGMPLELFWTVFVRPPELRASYRTVSQVEQMQVSRCYTGSDRKLGCTSCHDPHRQPSAEMRVEFYRSRCLNCHQDRGCSLPASQRQQRQPEDSCVACHMSKEGSSNILHVAVTDHRILRVPDSGRIQTVRPLAPGESPLRPFRSVPEPRLQRDLGIALARIATADPRRLETLARMALDRLIPVTTAHANDLAAWEARAEAHRRLGQLTEAKTALEHVLARRPHSENALTELADLCEQTEELVRAADLWQKANALNPDAPSYYLALARVLGRLGRWTEACRVAQLAVQLEPVNPDSRVMWISCLNRLGETAKARDELRRVIAMRPGHEKEIRQRFPDLLTP